MLNGNVCIKIKFLHILLKIKILILKNKAWQTNTLTSIKFTKNQSIAFITLIYVIWNSTTAIFYLGTIYYLKKFIKINYTK